jgi:hypothetical protein
MPAFRKGKPNTGKFRAAASAESTEIQGKIHDGSPSGLCLDMV